MHREAYQFVVGVKRQHPEFFTGKKVLEVGSLDINGSVRPFFTDCDYTGIDLGAGAGVDEVIHVGEFALRFKVLNLIPDVKPTPEFDVVISTEALEHDARWAESLQVMYDLLKPNGVLILTCAAPNRPEHGTRRTGNEIASPFTSDYYRNISIEDFAAILPANLFSKSYLGYRGNMEDLYFVGIKKAPIELLDLGMGHDLIEPRGGAMGTISVDAEHKSATVNLVSAKPLTVTAEISSKDRYHFLPLTISAILNQTRKPERLVIYDDGEQRDLRTFSPFDGLLRLADHLGIKWEFFSTPREGQVRNHQHALDTATTDLIFRCDDDEIPEPNCLESLLAEMKDGVGAVAGLVHHPTGVTPLPESVKGGLEDITNGTNIQWFSWNSGPKETEHLYSTFLFSVEAARKAGGYPKGLSAAGHREESWLTIAIRHAGYKLIVTPNAKTYHLRQETGGIRSYTDTSMWQHDDELFQAYLKTLGHVSDQPHLVILNAGIGDHLLFRGLLVDEFKRKYPDRKWRLAVCYPEVFNDLENVEIISIAEAKTIVGDRYQDYSLFEYGWHHGNGRHILDVMREFYGR